MTRYYYDQYQSILSYQETASQYATETAEHVGGWPNALVLVHDSYYFSSSTGKFSGRGESDEIFYKVLGDPDYPRYYVTPTWIMHIDSAKESGGVVKISGRKINNRAVWLRGQLYAEDIVAEDGTYPNNGRHTDGYWYVKKGVANTPPTISGRNEDLGNISDEINYKYTVFDEDGDTLSIVERLNNEVIEVRNNVKSGSEFIATIPKEKIYDLELGKKNTLQIEVSDGKERTYRNITFTRINTAPIIKVISEKELGEIIKPFESKVSISDPEEDKVKLFYTINRIVLDENESYIRIPVHTTEMEDIELDSEISYTIDKEVWDKLLISDYELEIKAIDDQSGENKEVITFTRTEDEIEFITPAIVKDIQPKQLISLWLINGNPTSIKIEACNNGLDENPAWEDVTTEATEATPYNFKNSTKTADKWAVMAKVSLDGKGGSK